MTRYITAAVLCICSVLVTAQTEKIGINTSSPDETVHVIGDIILLESPDGTKKVMLRTEGASGELKSLGDLYLRAQGNEIILNHVATDGNVAIGKTGPTEKLDVAGAIRVGTTTNMSSAEGTVKFESGDFQGFDGSEWKSFTAEGTGVWELALDSSIMYDNGKVIVGSTSDPQELDVTDNVTFRGELHMSSLAGANPTFKIVDNGTTFYMGPIRNGSDYYIQTTKNLILRTSGNSYSNKLVVRNDGKVGIGDGVDPSTLSEALTVDGAVNVGNTSTTNPGSIRYTATDGFEGYDDDEWKSLSDGGGSTPWQNSGADIYYDQGQVGIGTPTATSDLEVVNSTSISEVVDFTAGDLSSGRDLLNLSVGTGSSDQSQIIEANRGTTNVFRLDGNGSTFVGGSFEVGTTSDKMIRATYALDGSADDSRIDLFDRHSNNVLSLSSGGFDFGNGLASSTSLALSNPSQTSSILLTMDSPFDNPRMNLRIDNESKVSIGANEFYDGTNGPGGSQIKLYDYGTNATVSMRGDVDRSGVIDLYSGNISTSNASLNLHSNGGVKRVSVQGGDGLIECWNSDNDLTIQIDSDDNQAGQIYVLGKDVNGLDRSNIILSAKESSSQGGQVRLLNFAGSTAFELEADEASNMGTRMELSGYSGSTSGFETNVVVESNDNIGEGAKIYLRDWAGSQAIILDADFEGNARITTDELRIKGGSDLAEYFDVENGESKVKPGLIVSIDPNKPGGLVLSTEANDRLVAGVVSGANGVNTGFMMGQDGSIADGEYPIALTGRVYVSANEESGVIRAGDFLTTSSTCGEAMRVVDFQKAQGAIIGKAMTSRDDNGFVLVLVNLQ